MVWHHHFYLSPAMAHGNSHTKPLLPNETTGVNFKRNLGMPCYHCCQYPLAVIAVMANACQSVSIWPGRKFLKPEFVIWLFS